jgi:hypothetical protein
VRIYSIAFIAVLMIGDSAQAGIIVAPNANTSVDGNSVQLDPFGELGNPQEFQWVLNGSQLTGIVGDNITAIGFRLASGQSGQAPSTINSFDLELSSSNNPIGSLSTTYANNIGSNAVTVYNGSLSLPGLTGGAGPNPFFLITFTTPFTYTGGNLLMTLVSSSDDSFAVDANAVGDGLGDTVAFFPVNSTKAEYYNYPITEFQFTTPEPASSGLIALGLLAMGVLARHTTSR